MKHSFFLFSLAILAILTAVSIPQSALAYRGDPNTFGPNYSSERHEQMQKALANKDYAAWKKLMIGNGRVTQVINEKNFARFVEAHNLALQGKTAEANKIRSELGLGNGNGYNRNK